MPPRDPAYVPPPLKDDVGKHDESEFNEGERSDFGEDDDPSAIIEDDEEDA